MTRYAVCYPGKSTGGVPMPLLHGEYRDRDQAENVAAALCHVTGHAWVECWMDVTGAKGPKTRTAIERITGQQAETIVARFHARRVMQRRTG